MVYRSARWLKLDSGKNKVGKGVKRLTLDAL